MSERDSARRWYRVKDVLESALERTPADRDAFLTQACGEDSALRAEVESLLSAYDKTEQSHQPSVHPIDATAGRTDPGIALVSRLLKPGDELGPYEIVECLGAGGMGEVYKAMDQRLHRTVALKILKRDFREDSELRARFEREALAAAALRHPHVCVLHDIGRDQGVEFLVMEYLDGETLAERLDNGRLPPDQVFRYGIEIAEALAETHRHTIIHRDLKPGNIMLTASGAKLLDFGLAKWELAGMARVVVSETTDRLMGWSAVAGTLHYMAPEQLNGHEMDRRTDIFALGSVLYEMATGRKAFEGESRGSVIAAIVEREPRPIEKHELPALNDLIFKCLRKDPAERWQTADEIARELRRLAGKRAAQVERAARARISNRVLWVVALIALLTAALLWF
jgi:serine/threonine protein kinase